MVLKCLGSSSSGNCYILQSNTGCLIIEAGVPMRDIKKSLDWKLSNVVGCLVSHRHRDHSLSIRDMISNGIRVLALADVFDSHNIRNRTFCKDIRPMLGYKIGEFKVFVLPLAHDVPCVGFIIEHHDMGRLLFVTDTMMLEYKIPQVDHIMIEANYSDDVLRYNIEHGITPAAMKDRLLHSHMELGTLIDIINTNDLTNVQELILLHLSGDNSDEQIFIREVSKNAGKPIYVAKSGMNINLSKNPY